MSLQLLARSCRREVIEVDGGGMVLGIELEVSTPGDSVSDGQHEACGEYICGAKANNDILLTTRSRRPFQGVQSCASFVRAVAFR